MSIPEILAAQAVLQTARLTLTQLGPAYLDQVEASLQDEEAMA